MESHQRTVSGITPLNRTGREYRQYLQDGAGTRTARHPAVQAQLPPNQQSYQYNTHAYGAYTQQDPRYNARQANVFVSGGYSWVSPCIPIPTASPGLYGASMVSSPQVYNNPQSFMSPGITAAQQPTNNYSSDVYSRRESISAFDLTTIQSPQRRAASLASPVRSRRSSATQSRSSICEPLIPLPSRPPSEISARSECIQEPSSPPSTPPPCNELDSLPVLSVERRPSIWQRVRRSVSRQRGVSGQIRAPPPQPQKQTREDPVPTKERTQEADTRLPEPPPSAPSPPNPGRRASIVGRRPSYSSTSQAGSRRPSQQKEVPVPHPCPPATPCQVTTPVPYSVVVPTNPVYISVPTFVLSESYSDDSYSYSSSSSSSSSYSRRSRYRRRAPKHRSPRERTPRERDSKRVNERVQDKDTERHEQRIPPRETPRPPPPPPQQVQPPRWPPPIQPEPPRQMPPRVLPVNPEPPRPAPHPVVEPPPTMEPVPVKAPPRIVAEPPKPEPEPPQKPPVDPTRLQLLAAIKSPDKPKLRAASLPGDTTRSRPPKVLPPPEPTPAESLLSAIRKGAALRHVDMEEVNAARMQRAKENVARERRNTIFGDMDVSKIAADLPTPDNSDSSEWSV